jgi:hypothetical protein
MEYLWSIQVNDVFIRIVNLTTKHSLASKILKNTIKFGSRTFGVLFIKKLSAIALATIQKEDALTKWS